MILPLYIFRNQFNMLAVCISDNCLASNLYLICN